MKDPILVYAYDDAPIEYTAVAPRDGDEDWLAVVPASMRDAWVPWLESGGPFGVCDVKTYDLPDGRVVHIGQHA